MRIPIYHIDAFTNELFKGNPAAVCPLEEWITDDLMQKIAAENNLSETAFYIKKDDEYELRWFTPKRGNRLVWTCYISNCLFNIQLSRYKYNEYKI